MSSVIAGRFKIYAIDLSFVKINDGNIIECKNFMLQ